MISKQILYILRILYNNKIIPLLTKKNLSYIINIILGAINEQTSSSSEPILLVPFSNSPPQVTVDANTTVLDITNTITSVSSISYLTNSGATQSGKALPGIQCTVNYDITSVNVGGSDVTTYTLPCSTSDIYFGIVVNDINGNIVGGGRFSINSSTITPVTNLSQTIIIPFNTTDPVSGTYTLTFDFSYNYCINTDAVNQSLISNSSQISVTVA